MNLIILSLDFGSAPVYGLLAVVLTIIFYVLWALLDESSLQNHLSNQQYKNGQKGQHWQRNRKRRLKQRQKELDRLRRIKTPNFDDKYIYIMQSGGLYKVGISNNVIYRRDTISKKLNNPVVILYIGTVDKGRTIDAEQIILNELSDFNEPVFYNDGVVSREWFDCDLEIVVDTVSQYADISIV